MKQILRPIRPAVVALTVAGVLALAGGPLGARQRTAVPATTDVRTVTHVLNRLGFGPRPGDVERVQAMGLSAYIESQLQPERIGNEALEARLDRDFVTIDMSSREIFEKYIQPATMLRREQQKQQAQNAPAPRRGSEPMMPGEPSAPAAPPPSPEMRMAQAQQRNVGAELMQAKMLRAVLSERQLEEVLVDFWFNHFNVFVGKGQVRQYLTEYERLAIRPHVLGRFRDMLGAVAHSPAMLFYLDNFQSTTPNPPVVLNENLERRMSDPRLTPDERRRLAERLDMQRRPVQQRPQRGLNENYARELMELHTLGVNGGYTQKDVIELARILTGWTIDRPQAGGGFVFRPQMHDMGNKVLLGVSFAPAGEMEGERALDLLATHPSTARHLAYKLAQRFVADEPPAALVERAAETFRTTKGNLGEVVRVIVTSREFFAPEAFRAKVKSPLEFVASAVRVTGASVVNPQPMVGALQMLGMPLYGCQPPTGYSMTADAWVNTGALLNRMNFALQLMAGGRGETVGPRARGEGPAPGAGRGRGPGLGPGRAGAARGRGPAAQARGPLQVDIAGLAPDTSEASRERLVHTLLAGVASDGTRQTLARAGSPSELIALTLGSPEFQRR
jgi:uncharacterized protein (DUF1800 family)